MKYSNTNNLFYFHAWLFRIYKRIFLNCEIDRWNFNVLDEKY